MQTAVATAQALNCLSPRGEGESRDACGTCAACVRIARGVHPDVIVVEPGDSGSIKIEQIRDAIESAGYRPFEGRRRVVIVNEADAMAASPQNALLKMLEEPPPSSVFILITARPDMLLPTVRSRCQHLRFQPVRCRAPSTPRRATWRGACWKRRRAAPSLRQRIEAAKDLLKGTGGGNSGGRGSGATRVPPAGDGVAAARYRAAVDPGVSRAGQRGICSPSWTGSRRRIAASGR